MRLTTKRQLALLVVPVFLIASFGFAQEEKEEAPAKGPATYIGAKKCIMCHKTDGVGPSWQKTVHAEAWTKLTPEQQAKPECVECHITGKNATGEMLTGVQCESCHGPGSNYKSKTVMSNREKAVAAGLIIPDEKTCAKCHNDKIPKEFQPKTPWVYAEAIKNVKAIHAKAVKKEAAAGK
jgi:Cytochrome c554 and c-prime